MLGGRYDPKSLEGLRTSFKSAVELAKIEWDEKVIIFISINIFLMTLIIYRKKLLILLTLYWQENKLVKIFNYINHCGFVTKLHHLVNYVLVSFFSFLYIILCYFFEYFVFVCYQFQIISNYYF